MVCHCKLRAGTFEGSAITKYLSKIWTGSTRENDENSVRLNVSVKELIVKCTSKYLINKNANTIRSGNTAGHTNGFEIPRYQ